ncbi:hypothetical protein [Granulicella tundricola]|uniref:DUF308 domain-containing protein n=1 Tax=Granulicella tundricola (strain ATCC BAA-1859 / DSM 23138 / MP5ACTX9) TaxID=1198114 RepID=E8X3J2_GRATM|nr:hypothetical protein [Granulicella tundricola]ADW68183.1 hypothetical protein AciX9_1120 [Granulicella tundricola MP5ACTX9]
MTTNQATFNPSTANHFLRNLYLSRTVVQIVWAATVLATASTSPNLAVALVVLYPLWDVVCTIRDIRSNPQPESRSLLLTNAILGTATAIAVGILGSVQVRYAVALFGLWALLAGLLQLGVGIARRRSAKGQWAMILSGAQSTLAGTAFLIRGLQEKIHVKDLGGYAIFGAVYFLIAALLLSRKGSTPDTALHTA